MTTDVEGTGAAGDIVSVKRGFMRNYLVPNKLAAYNTDDNREKFADIMNADAKSREAAAAIKAAEAARVNTIATGVIKYFNNDNKLIISARATEDGNLYGSIGTAESIDSIKYSAHNTEKEFDQLSAIDVTFVDSTVSSIKNINDITQIRIAGHEVHVSVVAATDA